MDARPLASPIPHISVPDGGACSSAAGIVHVMVRLIAEGANNVLSVMGQNNILCQKEGPPKQNPARSTVTLDRLQYH